MEGIEEKAAKLIREGVTPARAALIVIGEMDPSHLANEEVIADLERTVYKMAKEGNLQALQFVLGNLAPNEWMVPGKRV